MKDNMLSFLLEKAVEKVLRGGVSLLEASRRYGVDKDELCEAIARTRKKTYRVKRVIREERK